MSGIVGIINRNETPINCDLLQRMTEFMSYRGPDAQQIWVDGNVGFGHTMLRTTRESLGEEQPFSLDGIWITADAR
ncbi:MAG TPA: asparagine synthetase B, partial [Phormidium sp.]